jgi:hypothetical protein
MNDMVKFFKHQLFLACHNDSLRDEVLEAKKDWSLPENWRPSSRIIHDPRKLQQSRPNSCRRMPRPWEDLTEEEIEQVAAIPACNDRFPPKRNAGGQTHPNGQARPNGPRNPNIACCYCQMKGHMQKKYHSCCWDNAPIGNAKGKPFENNHVNNVTKKQEDSGVNQKYEDAQVGAVANLSPYHHLNR